MAQAKGKLGEFGIYLLPDGREVFAARYRNPEGVTRPAPAILWDASSGEAIMKVEIPNTHFNAMALDENGLTVTGWTDGSLRVWAVPRRTL
jgi:hypothetical protein